MKKEKKGKALKKLKDKKEALLTARALVGTVHRSREADAFLTEHEVSLNGFDIVKTRIDEALDSLHRKGLAMVQEGGKWQGASDAAKQEGSPSDSTCTSWYYSESW